MICAMTGGHPDVASINLHLGQAASELGIAIGVGSQRAALEDCSLEKTFSIVRDAAPDVPVIGNIGAVQLKRSGPEIIERLADMIDADAIAVHLNFLQESIQPEGDRDACGVLDCPEVRCSGAVAHHSQGDGCRHLSGDCSGSDACRHNDDRRLRSGWPIVGCG